MSLRALALTAVCALIAQAASAATLAGVAWTGVRTPRGADAVLIAAPYWDLSFPSALKIWVEHMYVRNLTFRYENDRPVGLCSGRASCYITTSGSLIGENDWGAGYLRAVLQTLGIPGFTSFRAEALDLDGSDEKEIHLRAEENIKKAAPAWVRSWHEA